MERWTRRSWRTYSNCTVQEPTYSIRSVAWIRPGAAQQTGLSSYLLPPVYGHCCCCSSSSFKSPHCSSPLTSSTSFFLSRNGGMEVAYAHLSFETKPEIAQEKKRRKTSTSSFTTLCHPSRLIWGNGVILLLRRKERRRRKMKESSASAVAADTDVDLPEKRDTHATHTPQLPPPPPPLPPLRFPHRPWRRVPSLLHSSAGNRLYTQQPPHMATLYQTFCQVHITASYPTIPKNITKFKKYLGNLINLIWCTSKMSLGLLVDHYQIAKKNFEC